MNYLYYVDDFPIIAMVQISLNLRCSRISWMLILYFDFIPCCLSNVAHRVMIGYRLRYSKVVANKGCITPDRRRVYPRPLIENITRESLTKVEML